jgi:hypothetical protein
MDIDYDYLEMLVAEQEKSIVDLETPPRTPQKKKMKKTSQRTPRKKKIIIICS